MSTTADTALTASVLLATHNRRELLPAVLAPILADPATSEVVVVVDGCRDGSLELLQSMAQEEPRIKSSFVASAGGAQARAKGAQHAIGDVLVILDDDEIVDPGSISGHLSHHSGEGGLLVVGYVEMELPRVRRPGDFSRYMYARQYELDCRIYESDPEAVLRNLWGGFLSIDRADYLRLVANGQLFEGYHEDLDFGARCMEQGIRAVFDRSLRASHRYERDRAGFLRAARSSGGNRILVHRAHPDVLDPLDPSFVDAGLHPILRAVLRAALGHRQLERLLGGVTSIAGHLRLWHLETVAAGLMWAAEQKRGAIEASASAGALSYSQPAGVA